MIIQFLKTGSELREAITKRIEQLRVRLLKRDLELEKLMEDKKKLRSYLVRSAQYDVYGARNHEPAQLFSEDEIASEEREEMSQKCRRIFQIEQEIYRLNLLRTHLRDEQELNLKLEDLVAYGFDSDTAVED